MKKIFRSKFIWFLMGMLVMLILDMIFQLNNSVEKKIDKELNNAQRKIENAFN